MPNNRKPRSKGPGGAGSGSSRPAPPSGRSGGGSARGASGGSRSGPGRKPGVKSERPRRIGAEEALDRQGGRNAGPGARTGRPDRPAGDGRRTGPADRGRQTGTLPSGREYGSRRPPVGRAFENPADRYPEEAPESGQDIVFGRHAIMAALESDQSINKVWIYAGFTNQNLLSKIRQLAKSKGAVLQMVERAKLDSLTHNANHQGLVASVAAASYVDLDEVIETARAARYPMLLLLDGIEDPHNLGALIRSAEAAGVAGVIIPSRRAVGVTPVAVKVSAGAASRVPIARVGNVVQAAETLQKAGFWLVAADADAEKLPYEIDLTHAIVLVIGAEGKGVSRLLADRCDQLVKLPMEGQIESLNASVAGGILMYEAVRQRWAKGSVEAGK